MRAHFVTHDHESATPPTHRESDMSDTPNTATDRLALSHRDLLFAMAKAGIETVEAYAEKVMNTPGIQSRDMNRIDELLNEAKECYNDATMEIEDRLAVIKDVNMRLRSIEYQIELDAIPEPPLHSEAAVSAAYAEHDNGISDEQVAENAMARAEEGLWTEIFDHEDGDTEYLGFIIKSVTTFREAGVMTQDKGVILHTDTGAEIHLTIQTY